MAEEKKLEGEKQKESEIGEFQFYKPDDRTAWESFSLALYNSEKHQILGRTVQSWAKITVFYLIFYTFLAALWAASLQGLFLTLDFKAPKYQQEESLIGINPGVGIRPVSDKIEEGSMIYWNGKNESQSLRWVAILNEFMIPYSKNISGPHVIDCSFDRKPQKHEVCRNNVLRFGPCNSKDSYGYKGPSPCVFLKLNRIFGWTPDVYTEPSPEMPVELRNRILGLPPQNRSQIWVSCNGLKPQDDRFLEGGFGYHPNGFPSYYYPYTNLDNYTSPLVAVEIIYPKSNVAIGIECRAWAKNIKYVGGSKDREGSIQFYIMRDYLNIANA